MTSIDGRTSTTLNPLLKFTLRDQAAHLDEMAVAQKPLLGSFCLSGQGTVLCAPPNAGKTLITLALLIEAIDAKRIDGSSVFYVDADDTTQGVADKVRILSEYGVHVIAEGHHGFKASLLAPVLNGLIVDGIARGTFIILDTFKKFTTLMSKTETSLFTEVIRRFVLAGGSLLCLSHTNKNVDANGKNVFAGVSDIIDDLDCAYVIDVSPGIEGQKVITLTNKKRRGNNPDTVAYTYAAAADISYIERLTSVQETDRYQEAADGDQESVSEEDILHAIGKFIHHGNDVGKMALIRSTAKLLSISKRRVLKTLETYTGDDPERHRWTYAVRARGRHAYELHGPAPASGEDDDSV